MLKLTAVLLFLIFAGLTITTRFAGRPRETDTQSGVAFEERNMDMEPKLVMRDETRLIGIQVRTTNQQETDPAKAKIGTLWGRFYQEQIADKIPNKKSGDVVLAAYTKYESDANGPYTLVVGREVNSLASVPNGMTGVAIPAGKYLAFSAHGPVPKTIIDTWTYIWKYFASAAKYQRAYTTDYEVHSSPDQTDIYIAVK